MLAHEKIARYRVDPVFFVRDRLGAEPELWQIDALTALASNDRDKARIAMRAAVGVGKTSLLAWAIWWFMVTQASKGNHPKGLATSITGDNLKDNLWAELAKWRDRDPFLVHQFEWTKEKIYNREHPATWFFSARFWSKSANMDEQGRTFSGLHSDYVLVVVDECGEIPPPVLKAGDQALSKAVFGKILMAGNPTSHDGVLYQACTALRELWHVITITSDPDDPKRSQRVDVEWAKEQIKTFGRDNPWVMSSILGLFPPTSINALLGIEDVEAAMKRHIAEDSYRFAQKRIGIDVARFGSDATIIFPRQGLRAYKYVEMRGASTNDVAARVMLAKNKFDSEMEFVDGTGGFGSGVVDQLRAAGYKPTEVHFSSKAIDSRFFNKRSEIIYNMCEWVKNGGCLPSDPRLSKELVAPTYTFSNGKLRVEEKDQIRKRLGFSPDVADSLALTFSLPERPGRLMDTHKPYENNRGKAKTDWNPFKR